MLKEICAQTLETVAGGTKRSDLLQQQLTNITQSIKDVANQNTGSSSTTTLMLLAFAMQNRQQTVVAAPAATTVVAQPAFSFRARIRI